MRLPRTSWSIRKVAGRPEPTAGSASSSGPAHRTEAVVAEGAWWATMRHLGRRSSASCPCCLRWSRAWVTLEAPLRSDSSWLMRRGRCRPGCPGTSGSSRGPEAYPRRRLRSRSKTCHIPSTSPGVHLRGFSGELADCRPRRTSFGSTRICAAYHRCVGTDGS